jgi:signal transduction histidine kinase
VFISAGLYTEHGDKAKAQRMLEQGLSIREKIGDPFYIISDIFELGNFYAHNNETEKGIKIVREGIAIAEKYNMPEKLPILYSSLAENYKAANNLLLYSQALDTLIILKDSLYQKNSAEALAEIQTKYEVQKKENTIIQQQYDLTKKNFLIYSIAGLLVATLLFGFFFFKNRRKTQHLKMQAMEMEQKKKTTQAVMQAEEEERKRIAEDLHDSVAQKMVVAKLNLEAFGNHLQQMDAPQQKIYDNINLLLTESTSEVRNLSHSMMPQAFSRSGLTTAVNDFLDTIEQPQLKINFSAEGDFFVVKENKALMIYRIIQECVQNVLKHAQATQLDISMIAANNEADIIIEDNGVGFNAGAPGITESSGMKNIRSRIDYLSGKLDINSQPGNGTVIAFYIPLNHS